MPLHADGEFSWNFNSFDNAVRSSGSDLRAAGVFHRLVMRRIHLQLAQADDAMQFAAFGNADGMVGFARVVFLLVSGDVLVERATRFDAEQLHSAADAR